MNRNINAFTIEKRRTVLAEKKKYKQLSLLYSKNLPQIKNKNTKNLWDKLNERTDLVYGRNFMEEDKLNWISKKVKNGSVLLNIGFGSGNLENIILSKNNSMEWYGIDISDESVNKVSKKFPHAKFIVQNVSTLSFKSNSFDYIIALEILEHISPSQIFGVLGKLYKFLKKGGYIIVSIPLNEGLEEMMKNNNNPNEHVRVYTPELIIAELEIAGFRIDEYKMIYAFRKFYWLKSLIVNNIPNLKQPNGIIIVARKK